MVQAVLRLRRKDGRVQGGKQKNTRKQDVNSQVGRLGKKSSSSLGRTGTRRTAVSSKSSGQKTKRSLTLKKSVKGKRGEFTAPALRITSLGEKPLSAKEMLSDISPFNQKALRKITSHKTKGWYVPNKKLFFVFGKNKFKLDKCYAHTSDAYCRLELFSSARNNTLRRKLRIILSQYRRQDRLDFIIKSLYTLSMMESKLVEAIETGRVGCGNLYVEEFETFI